MKEKRVKDRAGRVPEGSAKRTRGSPKETNEEQSKSKRMNVSRKEEWSPMSNAAAVK